VAGEEVETGKQAKCFADYMRIHTLEATGGKTYAEMPQDSPQREIWVTETALTTALDTSYFAETVALFAIIVGIVMLLVGIGFVVLTVFSRRGTPAAPAAYDGGVPACTGRRRLGAQGARRVAGRPRARGVRG